MINRRTLSRWLVSLARRDGSVPQDGDVLALNGSVVWQSAGFSETCRLFRTANQSIPSATPTAIQFTDERFDPTGMHDPAVNNTRVTIATAGAYLVGANVEWATSLTGIRRLDILVNGTTTIGRVVEDGTIATPTETVGSTLYQFSSGDYIETVAFQDNVIAVNVLASGNYSPEMWVQRIA